MRQTPAGLMYQQRCIERLQNKFASADYLWERDILTGERIRLSPASRDDEVTNAKLNFLTFLIYSEGYGA